VASNVVAVAAGQYHSLFVTADGTLWAMGYNNYGQLGNGTLNNTNRPVSVASNVVAVAAGNSHSLFVKTDGTLWAMGYNGAGQLGNGTTSNTNRPVIVASNVVAVAAGSYHSLFVTADGTLWAMGGNSYGNLGNGTLNNTNRPVNVASNVVAATAGYQHSLFVKTDGTLWAMGYNGDGELGNGTAVTYTNLPVIVPHVSAANVFPADQASHSLAMGFLPTLATVSLGNLNQTFTGGAISVTAGTTPPGLNLNVTYNDSPNAPTNPGSYIVIVTVTDPNYYGSTSNTLVINPIAATVTLGNLNETYTGSAANVTANTMPSGLAVILTYFIPSLVPTITGSYTYTISPNAPTNTGSYPVIGTVSTPGYAGSVTNTLVIAGPSVTPARQAVAVGGTLTLTTLAGGTGQAYQWFKDSRLIVGATNSTLTVTNAGVINSGTYYLVMSNMSGIAISLPALVSVGNPSMMVCGSDNYGQLGNGTNSGRNPIPINVASNVVAGAAGAYHSLFVTADGTLWAMGYNAYGQLGNGTTINTNLPISVASNVVAVAAGGNHSLFVTADGALWAMGDNSFGELGNGTASNANLPVCVSHTSVANVFPADQANHSLAIGLNSNAVVTLGNLNQTYTGGAISVTASTTPPGLNLNLTYNGSPNAPTNPGSYTVIATVSDPNYYGSTSNTLVINPNATVTLGNLNQLYTGSAINVTVSTTPDGLAVNLTYNGSPDAPTNAGSYTVIGIVSTPGYVGSATNTLVVGLPPQSFTVSSTDSQQLTLQLTGTPGYPYILQSATNLTPPIVWQPVITNLADVNGNLSFTVTNLTIMPEGFYRAIGQ
jgi:alpha-tubulin suppressor-like RCC1 family protein